MSVATISELEGARRAKRFLDLFNPARHAYGIYVLNGTTRAKDGKLEGKAETRSDAITLEQVQLHVTGQTRCGFIPIHRTGRCYFAAIDIDRYPVDHAQLARKIAKLRLPLIVCRSKSGGAHLYAFFSAGLAAREARERLVEWASALWPDPVEVFPKQDVLDETISEGNWINAPYFGDSCRAVAADGRELTLDDFLDQAEALSKQDFADVPPTEEAAGEFDLERAAGILAPHWTSDRHLLALMVAGALLRSGVAHDSIAALIESVVETTHDEQPDDRRRCVSEASNAIDKGAPMFGIPKLRERLGADTDRFLAACGVTSTRVRLLEMNAEFAVINWEGRTAIVRQPVNPVTGWREVQLSSISDVKAWTRNQPRVGKRQVADWWLDHPERQQYNGVVFAPEREVPGYLNLWRGWAVEPVDAPEKCALWLDMVLNDLCSGDTELRNYVIAWAADAVQNPTDRPGVTLVFRGHEGTGKGTFARELGALFGEHFLHVRHARHITGNFNAHLVRALLVFADEAIYAGDKVGEGALKGLITEPTIPIEYKGKDVVNVANHIRIVMATNADWAVPTSLADRRFAVIDVSSKHANDRAYFGPIQDQMREGGRAALLHYLRTYDLRGFDLRKIPDTQARRDQQAYSMDPFVAFWFERLSDGPGWETHPETAVVMRDYKDMAGRYPLHETAFGIRLKKLFPTLRKDRIRDAQSGLRTRHYLLPELAEARKDFEAAMGRTMDWAANEVLEIRGYADV